MLGLLWRCGDSDRSSVRRALSSRRLSIVWCPGVRGWEDQELRPEQIEKSESEFPEKPSEGKESIAVELRGPILICVSVFDTLLRKLRVGSLRFDTLPRNLSNEDAVGVNGAVFSTCLGSTGEANSVSAVLSVRSVGGVESVLGMGVGGRRTLGATRDVDAGRRGACAGRGSDGSNAAGATGRNRGERRDAYNADKDDDGTKLDRWIFFRGGPPKPARECRKLQVKASCSLRRSCAYSITTLTMVWGSLPSSLVNTANLSTALVKYGFSM